MEFEQFTLLDSTAASYVAASAACKNANGFLPVMDTLSKSDAILAFFQNNDVLKVFPDGLVITFLGAELVAEDCSGGNVGVDSCYFRWIRADGSPLRIPPGATLASDVSGKFLNWMENYPIPAVNFDRIAMRKDGKWVSRASTGDVPAYVVCEHTRVESKSGDGGLPWWGIFLICIACLGVLAGCGVALWCCLCKRSGKSGGKAPRSGEEAPKMPTENSSAELDDAMSVEEMDK